MDSSTDDLHADATFTQTPDQPFGQGVWPPEGDWPEDLADQPLLMEESYDDDFEAAPGYPPKCPPPTPFKVTRQRAYRSKLRQVSSTVYAKDFPVNHSFCVNRSFTIGTGVEGSFKSGLGLIEHELKVRLDVTLSFSTNECVQWKVPKKQAGALFAGALIVERVIERTAYGSANCNVVKQWVLCRTPYSKLLEVRRVL